MAPANLRVLVLAVVMFAGGMMSAVQAGMSAVHADHISAQNWLPPPENAAFLFYVQDGVNKTGLDAVLAFMPAGVHVSAIPVSPSELARALGAVGGNATASASYNGTVSYIYGPNPESGLNYPAGQWLRDIRFLETQAELFNTMFRLPYNLTILAQECGEPNAFYGGSVIILCYEKIDYNWNLWNSARYNELYRPDMPTCPDPESEPETVCPYPKEFLTSTPESVFAPGERTDYLYHTTLDALYHGLGNAVLDMYNVSYTGSRVNVADQFAAYMFSLKGAEGQEMMRDVAGMYRDMVNVGKEYPTYVAHPLNIQRHYNYLCWLYGSDPDSNSDLLIGFMPKLPYDRAVGCIDEFKAVNSAFGGMLAG